MPSRRNTRQESEPQGDGRERLQFLKFWPKDWRGDEQLRPCSLAARGLWIELLGYMHTAEPRGYLLPAGQRPTVGKIAELVAASVEEVKALLEELEAAAVFNRNEAGIIYSRKMVRETKVSDAQRARINQRWAKPEAAENAEEIRSGKPSGKPPVNTGKDTGSILRARTQSLRVSDKDSGSNEPDGSASVVAALRLYPNGEFNSWNMCLEVLRELGGISGSSARSFVGKLKSEFKLDDSGLAEIAVATWAAKTQDPRSFMRQVAARKGSEINTAPGADRFAGFTEDQRRQLADIHRSRLTDYAGGRGAWDIRANGPKPGERGCKILPEVLREFGFEVVQ